MRATLKYRPIHEEVENLRFQSKPDQELPRILHELIFMMERLEERVDDLSSKASDSSKAK